MKWTREKVRAELLDVLKGHAMGEVEVTDRSHLVADLSIDSLGVMELIADIEDKFNLNIPDEALREVETVADVASAIEVRLQSDGRLAG